MTYGLSFQGLPRHTCVLHTFFGLLYAESTIFIPY